MNTLLLSLVCISFLKCSILGIIITSRIPMQYIHPSCYIVAMCHIYTANLYYSMKIRLQTSGYIEYNYSERY